MAHGDYKQNPFPEDDEQQPPMHSDTRKVKAVGRICDGAGPAAETVKYESDAPIGRFPGAKVWVDEGPKPQ